MLFFCSISCLFFLLLYFITPVAYKNIVALFGSLFFYAWGGSDFIFILLLSIVIDFYLVRNMDRAESLLSTQASLYLSLGLNIGLLLYFKYANFFIENVNFLLQDFGYATFPWARILLPIGISFFTFQKISYAMDVYYGKEKPLQELGDYALYIILFPQLIAGPIVRFQEIAGQLKDRRANLTVDHKLNGLFRFAIGLSKKLFIANVLGEYVDMAFEQESFEFGTLYAWCILLAYAFQIYFDFSGYSDMAIGLGLLMGFRIPENFNFPYISRSITEFWRRWHISLSRWMRDYLYIPSAGIERALLVPISILLSCS